MNANAKKRPVVVWLDDDIETYFEHVANITFNGMVCVSCKKVGELFSVLSSPQAVDVIILDLVLGGESGENFVETLQRMYPQVGLLVYSGKVATLPASSKDPVERLAKSLTEVVSLGSPDLLTKSILNAMKFRRSSQRVMRTLGIREKLLLLPWDFLLGVFLPIRRPFLAGVVLVIGAIQIYSAAALDTESEVSSMLPVAKALFGAEWPVLAAIVIAAFLYILCCPPDIRGISSRQTFDAKWRAKYMINPSDRTRIHGRLNSPEPVIVDDKEAIGNVNAYFENLRLARHRLRYLVAISMAASLAVYLYQGGLGLAALLGF